MLVAAPDISAENFLTMDLEVTGIDPVQAMINIALSQRCDIHYIIGDALALSFNNNEFDYSFAVTSLCFIEEYQLAFAEMLRVSKKRIALLNSKPSRVMIFVPGMGVISKNIEHFMGVRPLIESP